jgi:hypothetical protein
MIISSSKTFELVRLTKDNYEVHAVERLGNHREIRNCVFTHTGRGSRQNCSLLVAELNRVIGRAAKWPHLMFERKQNESKTKAKLRAEVRAT